MDTAIPEPVNTETGKNRKNEIDSAFILLGLRVKMCVWLGVSRGLDLAFLNAD